MRILEINEGQCLLRWDFFKLRGGVFQVRVELFCVECFFQLRWIFFWLTVMLFLIKG